MRRPLPLAAALWVASVVWPSPPVGAVARAAVLTAVACPQGGGDCLAVGQADGRAAIAVPLQGGRPAAAVAVPVALPSRLTGVACAGASCLAVGDVGGAQPAGFYAVLPASGTGHVAASALPGAASLAAVACAADNCVAAGQATDGDALFVPVAGGTGRVGGALTVPGFVALAIACPGSRSCLAVGRAVAPATAQGAAVLPITVAADGALGAGPIRLVAGAWRLDGVACPSAAACLAVGAVRPSGPAAAVAVSAGEGAAARPVPSATNLTAVACPAGAACTAVGAAAGDGVGLPAQTAVWAAIGATGVAVPAQPVVGLTRADGVACAADGRCLAVGVGHGGGAAAFLSGPGPTVSAVVPAVGGAAGGQAVTVWGTDLAGATEVEFGSTPALDVVAVSATAVTALTPPGSPGTVDVRVVTPAGESPVTAADAYTYVAAPTLGGRARNAAASP